MHSLQVNQFTTFHFDGGFDGDVVIVRHDTGSDDGEMRIPMSALDCLFAERIRRAKISAIESMEDSEVIQSAIRGV